MTIYYLLLLFAIALGFFLSKKEKGKIIYVVIMGLALFKVSAFRRATGYDYNLYGGWYYDYFFKSIDALTTEKVEKGFSIPFKIMSRVFYDYQAMFIVIALVITLLVMVYIYKKSSNVFISVSAFLCFGLFFNSMNFMRQIIASAIVMYALRYIESKQFLRFLAIVLFASTIHFSALLMIPFFFILQIRMNYIVLGIYSAFGIAAYMNSNAIMDFVTKYVYKSYDPTNNIEVTKGLTPVYLIAFAIFFILAFLLRKDLIKKRAFNSILINCAFFTMFFEFFGTKHTIISRFAILFYIAPILLLSADIIPLLIQKAKKLVKTEKLAVICVYSVVLISRFSLYQYFLSHNYNGVVPYKTIFSSEEISKQESAN